MNVAATNGGGYLKQSHGFEKAEHKAVKTVQARGLPLLRLSEGYLA